MPPVDPSEYFRIGLPESHGIKLWIISRGEDINFLAGTSEVSETDVIFGFDPMAQGDERVGW
jgi:hypothetical protein